MAIRVRVELWSARLKCALHRRYAADANFDAILLLAGQRFFDFIFDRLAAEDALALIGHFRFAAWAGLVIHSAVLIDILLDLLDDGLRLGEDRCGFEIADPRIELIQPIKNRLGVQIFRGSRSSGRRRGGWGSTRRAPALELIQPLFQLLQTLEQHLPVVGLRDL